MKIHGKTGRGTSPTPISGSTPREVGSDDGLEEQADEDLKGASNSFDSSMGSGRGGARDLSPVNAGEGKSLKGKSFIGSSHNFHEDSSTLRYQNPIVSSQSVHPPPVLSNLRYHHPAPAHPSSMTSQMTSTNLSEWYISQSAAMADTPPSIEHSPLAMSHHHPAHPHHLHQHQRIVPSLHHVIAQY